MQPAAESPPDASVGCIAGGMLLAVVLIFAVGFFFAVRDIGGDQKPHEFAHRFVVLDADGLIVDDSSFVFTMNPDDFDADWRPDVDSEGRVVGAALSSPFRLERRDSNDEICLSEPFVFMWAGSFEVAAEIPAGTCLYDRGETQVVLR